MNNFAFFAPTNILFGRDQVQNLGQQVKNHASRVLLLYGKGSIKRTSASMPVSIYDAVVAQLNQHGIAFCELGGVDPNPRISTVVEGAELCRRENLDLVLAVGGGSTIDCAKAIAAAACYAGDPWDFWSFKAQVTSALAVGAVLTLSATGSEMNSGTVITNEVTLEKRGMGAPALFPRFSILDPVYTFSVPPNQTAAGVADIMTHVYEYYFSPAKGAYVTDAIAEAILKTCVKYGPLAYREPEHYEARANLMWASSLALNGVVKTGKTFDGFNHMVEHAISAIYDLTHGVGLAILAPHWMEYVLSNETAGQFAAFARSVWGLSGADDMALARAGIRATRDFYSALGLPAYLSQVGIGSERFDEIAEKSMRAETLGAFKPLTRTDVLAILQHALAPV